MIRTCCYLLSVLPVTWALAFLATLPAALLLPPDILSQSILSVPLFCIGGGWVAGWLVTYFALPETIRTAATRRRIERFVTVLHLVVIAIGFAGIFTGFVTPTEALVLIATALLSAHGIAFRRWLRG